MRGSPQIRCDLPAPTAALRTSSCRTGPRGDPRKRSPLFQREVFFAGRIHLGKNGDLVGRDNCGGGGARKPRALGERGQKKKSEGRRHQEREKGSPYPFAQGRPPLTLLQRKRLDKASCPLFKKGSKILPDFPGGNRGIARRRCGHRGQRRQFLGKRSGIQFQQREEVSARRDGRRVSALRDSKGTRNIYRERRQLHGRTPTEIGAHRNAGGKPFPCRCADESCVCWPLPADRW